MEHRSNGTIAMSRVGPVEVRSGDNYDLTRELLVENDMLRAHKWRHIQIGVLIGIVLASVVFGLVMVVH